ncbi:MAG: nascent polypeptide-associated complex protein [Candidatus Pacearchaeota archaeon]|jgi:nascent polypeptide-associated complex subunit alpha
MNINPNQMKAMMKQMGINQKEIDALRVIIETESENIVIENPSVMEINMQGNKSWQISGDEHIEEKAGFSDEDIKIVMEKTGSSEHDARKALEKTKDIAEAIIELSE